MPQTLIVGSTHSHTNLFEILGGLLEWYHTEIHTGVSGAAPIIPPKVAEHTKPTQVFYWNTTTLFQCSKTPLLQMSIPRYWSSKISNCKTKTIEYQYIFNQKLLPSPTGKIIAIR